MKIKSDFVLRRVADTWVVLPLGDTSIKFNGMINLNETAAFIWKELESEKPLEDIAANLALEYSVTQDVALADIKHFIQKLVDIDCVE